LTDDAAIEFRSEGDLNRSAQRAEWQRQNIDAETRRWLADDERYFAARQRSFSPPDERQEANEKE